MHQISSKTQRKPQSNSPYSRLQQLRKSKQLGVKKNPQQQNDQQLRMLVRSYLKDKNLQELKSQLHTQRIIKKRNKFNSEHRKSITIQKPTDQIDQCLSHRKVSENNHNQSLLHVDNHKANCENCRQCTCKNHHCQTNQIKFKFKDPISKFTSNYTRNTNQIRSNLHLKRPQITASYYSSQLQNLPQYSPKFQTLNLDSSYKAHYNKPQQDQRVQSFKYLKFSNVHLGNKNIKNFQSSYQHQYNIEKNIENNKIKSPNPFIVRQPQNLNNFGLKYNVINSNYLNDFNYKSVQKRAPLKPPSLLKDLDLRLIKQSKYQQVHSPRAPQVVKSSKKTRPKHQKMPILHHLSSSFIPMDGITVGSQFFDSSYKKDYIRDREANYVKKYACPQGIKSSNGAASKMC